MGVESDYLIADRSEAKKIIKAEGSHWEIWPTLLSKGIDQLKLTILWGLLNGSNEFDKKLYDSFELLLEQDGGGCWVYLVPKRFLTKLMALPDKDLKKIATTWVKAAEFHSPYWTKETISKYLQELIAFAHQAKDAKKDLLLWVSL